MVKLKDLLEIVDYKVQIVDSMNCIVDIEFTADMDGKRCSLLSDSILKREVDWIECEKEKAILHLKEM